MKSTTFRTRFVRLLWMTWMLLPMAKAAEPGELRVPPWYRSNAVLAQPSKPLDSKRLLIGGQVYMSHKLKAQLEGAPGGGLHVDNGRYEKGNWKTWMVRMNRFTRAENAFLDEHPSFDVTVKHRRAPKSGASGLTLTNLCLGPLFAVHVDPERDSFDLPECGPAVLSRVRVLILTNGVDPTSSAQWMTAAEAVQRKLPGFCGMPRALAERLVRWHDGHVGLVILARSGVDRPPGNGRALVEVLGSNRSRHPAWFVSLAELVSDAVTGKAPPFNQISASARYERRYAAAEQTAKEARREGREVPVSVDLYRWSHISRGDRSALPFAVTAEVW